MIARYLIAFLLLWGAAQAQTCGPDRVPAPAATQGFNCEIFWDGFTSLSTVDVNNTLAPGFKWYVQVAGNTVTPATAFVQTGGGLQITPATNDATYGLWNMGSCAALGSGNHVGTTISGSMYVDIQLTTWGLKLGGNNWWPATWMLGSEQIYAVRVPTTGVIDSPEPDVLEGIASAVRYFHFWHIVGSGGPPDGSQTDSTGGGIQYVSSSPTFASGYTYGVLLLDPLVNSGTGVVIGYLNDFIEGTSTPVTWGSGSIFTNTTRKPMCILFTSGNAQPIVIRSVQVWTTTPTGVTPLGGGARRRLR
jgi:hypothetical protein